jgi:hypothetical protein
MQQLTPDDLELPDKISKEDSPASPVNDPLFDTLQSVLDA